MYILFYFVSTETTALEGCDLCDPGWYCDAPGLTTPRAPCDPGYVCYEGAYTSDPTDGVTGEICPAGGYCPLGKFEIQSNRIHKCNMNLSYFDNVKYIIFKLLILLIKFEWDIL